MADRFTKATNHRLTSYRVYYDLSAAATNEKQVVFFARDYPTTIHRITAVVTQAVDGVTDTAKIDIGTIASPTKFANVTNAQIDANYTSTGAKNITITAAEIAAAEEVVVTIPLDAGEAGEMTIFLEIGDPSQ